MDEEQRRQAEAQRLAEQAEARRLAEEELAREQAENNAAGIVPPNQEGGNNVPNNAANEEEVIAAPDDVDQQDNVANDAQNNANAGGGYHQGQRGNGGGVRDLGNVLGQNDGRRNAPLIRARGAPPRRTLKQEEVDKISLADASIMIHDEKTKRPQLEAKFTRESEAELLANQLRPVVRNPEVIDQAIANYTAWSHVQQKTATREYNVTAAGKPEYEADLDYFTPDYSGDGSVTANHLLGRKFANFNFTSPVTETLTKFFLLQRINDHLKGLPNNAQNRMKIATVEREIGAINVPSAWEAQSQKMMERQRVDFMQSQFQSQMTDRPNIIAPPLLNPNGKDAPDTHTLKSIQQICGNVPFSGKGNTRSLESYLRRVANVIRYHYSETGAYNVLMQVLSDTPLNFVEQDFTSGESFAKTWVNLQLLSGAKSDRMNSMIQIKKLLTERPEDLELVLMKLKTLVHKKNAHEATIEEQKKANNKDLRDYITTLISTYYPHFWPTINALYSPAEALARSIKDDKFSPYDCLVRLCTKYITGPAAGQAATAAAKAPKINAIEVNGEILTEVDRDFQHLSFGNNDELRDNPIYINSMSGIPNPGPNYPNPRNNYPDQGYGMPRMNLPYGPRNIPNFGQRFQFGPRSNYGPMYNAQTQMGFGQQQLGPAYAYPQQGFRGARMANAQFTQQRQAQPDHRDQEGKHRSSFGMQVPGWAKDLCCLCLSPAHRFAQCPVYIVYIFSLDRIMEVTAKCLM